MSEQFYEYNLPDPAALPVVDYLGGLGYGEYLRRHYP